MSSILSLSYESNGAWITLAAGLVSQFKVVTAERTKVNRQRVDALRAGRHFYSTGEILLGSSSIEDGEAKATFSWTYPLRYVQLVYSDGEQVSTVDLPQNNCVNFGKADFQFSFPKGMKWARVLAVDIAGNATFGIPVFLRK